MSKREYPEGPVVGVGAVVMKDGKVLLVKRGVDPNKGVWAIPGGSLKLGETLQEGAEREIMEETGITVRAKEPVYSFDFFESDSAGRVRFHYVVVDMMADYIGGEVQGADDALEARWVSPEELKDMEVSRNTLKILDSLKIFSD
ncbi:MAG: NUDIX hydrolase [Deltaproteobacteria bacterium]|nr:NUDIX hydrolase [Deltaproteobacteria bacterium]